nr:hypothetical protein [Tanacetum cinerariifolium]
MILSGVDNRPSMLDKDLYDSWKSRMELYMQNTIHGRMILELVENGPLIWPTIEENESGFVVPVFSPGDDPIACLNKAMGYSATSSKETRSKFSGTGCKSNATSSGGNNSSGQARVVKCYNCQGEGHMARQCTQPKRPRNATWGSRWSSFSDNYSKHTAFQTEDLDRYDSDCDDISNAQAVLMTNISSYGSDVILEEKANMEQNNESVTAELERYKERVKTFEQRLNIDLHSLEKMIDSQMDDMVKEKLALKEQVDSLEQNLSKQIKEKECLLQTFTAFKRESKEKEAKNIENEINLEKKIKELDNIIFKVAWYMDKAMLAKAQEAGQILDEEQVAFLVDPGILDGQVVQTIIPNNTTFQTEDLDTYDSDYDDVSNAKAILMANISNYGSKVNSEKAQRIKPTLYDGIVISDKHVAMPLIDDEETLMLEEAFWYRMSNLSTESSNASPVKMETPKELPK